MELVYVIRHKVLVEGKSRRQVARELGISRTTVGKYLTQSEPVRQETKARSKWALGKAQGRIDELLEEWGKRTTDKQRLTGSRIFEQVRGEGFQIGKTTVIQYVSHKRREGAEVYVPLLWPAGEAAQVDFFEVAVELDRQPQKVWKFLMRLMYSGRDFIWLYEHCDQVSFLDGHVRAFEYFGSVPKRAIFDNLTLAVKRRVGVERQLTDRFLALCSHYLFEPNFTRPGEGHDKGGVESRGKHIRWQHLTPVPRGNSLGEISQAVLKEIERSAATKVNHQGQSVCDLFEIERQRLRPLPPVPFESRQLLLIRITSKATVQIQGALYSVPDRWACRELNAYVGVEDIRFVCGSETQTVTKVRAGSRNIKYRDYLPTLARKPQAVRQVAPALTAELGEPFGKLRRLLEETHGGLEAGRVFAKILSVMTDHGEEVVRAALQQALDHGRADLLKLRAVMGAETHMTVPVPEKLREYEIQAGRSSDYDWLLVNGGVV